MANATHLTMLFSERDKWQDFRDIDVTLKPDLSQADLTAVDLRGYDLSDSDLRGTKFHQALLSGVDFSECNLGGTDFSEADLTGADFYGAVLNDSVLSETRASHVNFGASKVVGAKFVKAALAGANFEHADLEHANFEGADLRRASFNHASGMRVNFQSANLKCASFRGADLRESDFTGAYAQGASFVNAILSNGNLAKVNLTGAEFGESILADCNFKKAEGLELCNHGAPSFIDFRTLHKFTSLPYRFLIGCGLSDWQIKAAELENPELDANQITNIGYDLMNARTGKPIQIGSLFISYSQNDSGFVDALTPLLTANGIRFWLDVKHATAGRLDQQIDRAIRLNSTTLIILSTNSVASDWVEWEANRARELEREMQKSVLCPVTLDAAWKTCNWNGPLRTQLQKYNILDFSQWKDVACFEEQFSKLVSGLKLFYQR